MHSGAINAYIFGSGGIFMVTAWGYFSFRTLKRFKIKAPVVIISTDKVVDYRGKEEYIIERKDVTLVEEKVIDKKTGKGVFIKAEVNGQKTQWAIFEKSNLDCDYKEVKEFLLQRFSGGKEPLIKYNDSSVSLGTKEDVQQTTVIKPKRQLE